MVDANAQKEINEAINAGERALVSLRSAQGELNSAGGWGIVDLLGGGLFTDLIKHSKMDNASRDMEQAKIDLQNFQRELRDVDVQLNLNLNISGFLTFADFFFDGIIADYLVQSKIDDAKHQVKDAIQRVENILMELRSL